MNTLDTPFYDYDFNNPLTKINKSNRKDRNKELLYYNPVSNKWVTKKTIPSSVIKWEENGSRIKNIFVPKKLSDERIERTSKINKLLDLVPFDATPTEIKVVLHVIFSRSFYADHFGFSPIHCRKFSNLVGQKSRSILEYCKRFNWIKINDFFLYNCEQAHCKTYKISNTLLPNDKHFKFRKTRLDDVKITNKFQKKEKSYIKYLSIKNTHIILAQIAKKAQIDLQSFKNEIASNPEKFKNRKLDLAFYLIEQINSGDITIKETIDTFGERFFSGFSNIISETRKHIFFNSADNKLVETDISNSQIYFFSLLANKKFFNDILLKNTYNLEDRGKFNELDYQLSFVTKNKDFLQFCQDACNGIVYENIAKHNKDWDRDKAKSMMMKVLFARSGQYRKAKKTIRKIYPSVINVIEKLSVGVNAKTVSMACQRAESIVLLDRICQKLYHDHKIKEFITIHDSILASSHCVKTISKCILDEFILLGVKPPKLKIGK